MFYRKLSAEEEESFRAWARKQWEPGKPSDAMWHPVVREEWAKLDNAHCTVPDRKEEDE